MKHLIIGDGEGLGIASHIAHAKTITNTPVILVGSDEAESGINTELPQLVLNIIEDAKLTRFEELTPMSGREKRRERRKQNRKNK